MAKTNVEARFAAIEADIAQLKKQVASNDKAQNNWLTETFGVYADFPEYDQVIECGRQYRGSLKPLAKSKSARLQKTKKRVSRKSARAFISILVAWLFPFFMFASAQPQTPAPNQEREAAIALYKQGKTNEAIQAIRKFLSDPRNEKDAEAWYCLGMAYFQSGGLKESRQAFEQVLQLRPDSDAAHANYASLLLALNDSTNALKETKVALTLNQNNPDAVYLFAILTSCNGTPEANLREADKMIQNNFGVSAAHLLKSQAYLGLYAKDAPMSGTIKKEALRKRLLELLNNAYNELEAYFKTLPQNSGSNVFKEQVAAVRILIENGGAMEWKAPYKKPNIIYQTPARYTDAARNAKISGRLKLLVLMAADGKIKLITPVTTLEHGLTEQAMSAAKVIKFTPATKDGTPIPILMSIEYTFETF
jgi:tetratricopeptide (TPR) repeat protein